MANNTDTQTDPAPTNPAPLGGPDAVLPPDGRLKNHPLSSLFGKYRQDPNWEQFMEDIRAYRREVDAEADARK